ncbi:MAG: nitrogenase cofactor biosynthesis protein NifB [Cyanobacteria bacterium SID2]|nr:nitrogenase cofactor biosynthesis protein NifB [Cyanobacteria bacterium SID2]MBP0004126.1 nitrogenase cofactor biosynthesis protein NifB [Cyanobacteria bacterium SBC]
MTTAPTHTYAKNRTASGGCASEDCGVASDRLDAALQERIADHPCYSEEAHHHYARMHVAVAPICNIQCNYCNRKYDCANESRPGVVSELLTPEEAALKVLVVAREIPQLSVVGIAGPGDPLANPERTFRTFELIAESAPDLKLCLSTNGLMLPDYVDRIKDLGIDHVTVTLNAIDPEIAAKIYPWVRYKGKYYRGLEGAKILLDRQMEGLEALQQADVLCKTNSVLIPGINDEHLVEVNQALRDRGVFLHNIMPLISAPEHGTYFGKTGQREPSQAELTTLQDRCETHTNVMRHCRQCRADAVGLLGEDRSLEFTKANLATATPEYDMAERQQVREGIEAFRAALRTARATVARERQGNTGLTVQVAIATKGSGLINQPFGHAKEFAIYEVNGSRIRFVGHRKIDRYRQSGYSEAATESGVVRALDGCRAVLASKIGPCSRDALEQAGIEAVETTGEIEVAVANYYDQVQHHAVNAQA